MTNKNWHDFHVTKSLLLHAIEDHLESIEKVNVYSGSRKDIQVEIIL